MSTWHLTGRCQAQGANTPLTSLPTSDTSGKCLPQFTYSMPTAKHNSLRSTLKMISSPLTKLHSKCHFGNFNEMRFCRDAETIMYVLETFKYQLLISFFYSMALEVNKRAPLDRRAKQNQLILTRPDDLRRSWNLRWTSRQTSDLNPAVPSLFMQYSYRP